MLLVLSATARVPLLAIPISSATQPLHLIPHTETGCNRGIDRNSEAAIYRNGKDG